MPPLPDRRFFPLAVWLSFSVALLVGYGRHDPMLLLLALLWLGVLVAVVLGLLRLQRQFNRRAANARFVYSSQTRQLDGRREPGWIGD